MSQEQLEQVRAVYGACGSPAAGVADVAGERGTRATVGEIFEDGEVDAATRRSSVASPTSTGIAEVPRPWSPRPRTPVVRPVRPRSGSLRSQA